MGIDAISAAGASQVYESAAKTTTSAKKEEVTETSAAEVGAVYEKGTTEKKATYSINKMSAEDRAALVQQLKDDQAAREQSLLDMVNQMMTGQGKAFSLATGDDSIWKFLASGEFTVSPEVQKQAQEDISENGYWGVNQTAQRLFDFASALAGDDVDKMKNMQNAMMKGYKEATKAWGRDLPDISKQTIDKANSLFEEYYKSKETNVVSE
ncbi:MAG: hypothetical protein HUJ70_09755 [Pseudobutyrivibrio sp.]|nr:hypothetical protein [Pseudobutyrivibrio sp.]